jgi:hypothetical protein
MKYAFILLALLLTTPAHAGLWKEAPESYYARHMKSCIVNGPRTSVWDFFTATRVRQYDQCCVDSVHAMQKAGGKRIAHGETCEGGRPAKSLPCETSKHWCE